MYCQHALYARQLVWYMDGYKYSGPEYSGGPAPDLVQQIVIVENLIILMRHMCFGKLDKTRREREEDTHHHIHRKRHLRKHPFQIQHRSLSCKAGFEQDSVIFVIALPKPATDGRRSQRERRTIIAHNSLPGRNIFNMPCVYSSLKSSAP